LEVIAEDLLAANVDCFLEWSQLDQRLNVVKYRSAGV
jgi:hypothetical protein